MEAIGKLIPSNGQNGMSGSGTIFQVTQQGELRTIANFDELTGGRPLVPLVLGSDGNLYGITYLGGRFGAGTFFRLVRRPEITLSQAAASAIRVNWSCFGAGSFRLESKSHLSDTDWLRVSEITTAAGTTNLTNYFSGETATYFRVVALP